MTPIAWADFRRILVVRLDNIGDVVMLGPALRALRKAAHQASLTLMASPSGAQAAPLLPWVDDVIVHRALWQDVSGVTALGPDRERDLVATIRGGRFDAAFVFTSFAQSPYPPAYACYLAGVPVRVGQSKEFAGGVLSHWIKPPPDDAHQVDRNLHLLESLELPVEDRRLELVIPSAAETRAGEALASVGVSAGAPYIVLAPGASCTARTYPPERWLEVVRHLNETVGAPIVLVGSVREEGMAAALRRMAGPGVLDASLVGRTSVPELAAVVRRARLVMTNNSGPMHLADAFQRPLVVTYSGTDLWSQWWPRSAPARLLARPVACSPCYGLACPYHLECLDVAAGDVVRAALGLLHEAGADVRPPPLAARAALHH